MLRVKPREFGSGTDGRLPGAGLITDATGNLYGMTQHSVESHSSRFRRGNGVQADSCPSQRRDLERVDPLELWQSDLKDGTDPGIA
jgi:hypothetical protein